MTIPTSLVSLSSLQSEFGGNNPISLSEYRAGGSLVNPTPTSAFQTAPISSSGPISLGMFKGVSKITPVSFIYPTAVDMYGHGNGPWPFSTFLAGNGGVNALNLHFILTAAGGLPANDSSAIYTWSVTAESQNFYSFGISNPQDSGGSELAVPLNQPNQSIKDFNVSGDHSGNNVIYRVKVTDGFTTASLDLYVGLWW